MYQLSIKISLPLYEELKKNALAKEISVSDVVREWLAIGAKKLNSSDSTASVKEANLQQCLAIYTLFTHSLLEQFVKNTVHNGQQLCDLAEAKAEQLALTMLKVSDTT